MKRMYLGCEMDLMAAYKDPLSSTSVVLIEIKFHVHQSFKASQVASLHSMDPLDRHGNNLAETIQVWSPMSEYI